MSWIITGSFAQPDEPEALDYIAAVEAADGQTLEDGVKFAYNSFIKGCKADGIWDAIKASCILAGARTLNGALVPLVGTAPIPTGFVTGDYNRETGLKGDGSTKYLDSNRASNADPQNNHHLSVYETSLSSTDGARIGTLGNVANGTQHNYLDRFSGRRFASRGITVAGPTTITAPFLGLSRSSSTVFSARINGTTSSNSGVSNAITIAGDYFVFNRSGSNFFSNARLSFYSIGESLDLALLDARVTTLMSDLAAAIP